MRTVEDEAGRHYLLEKRSGDASRVRDLETGQVRHLRNDRLSTVEGVSPLEAIADSVDPSLKTLITATPDAAALGLLLDLHHRGPLPVRDMLTEYDLCESDLHGRLTEYRAAGLVAETEVSGERGYGLTDRGEDAVEVVQSAGIDG